MYKRSCVNLISHNGVVEMVTRGNKNRYGLRPSDVFLVGFNTGANRAVEALFKCGSGDSQEARFVLAAVDAVELAIAILECAVYDDQKLQGRLFYALPKLARLINQTG